MANFPIVFFIRPQLPFPPTTIKVTQPITTVITELQYKSVLNLIQ